MQIKLIINGKEKTFIAPFVSARRLKETLALSNKTQKGFDENVMDEVGEYLVNIYGKQFTLDQIYDGLSANDFLSKAVEDMQEVIGGFDNAVKN